MEQLLIHLFGDYILQSDWMAQEKTKKWFPACAHALTYALPFLIIGSWKAVLVIGVTHFFIDRYRLIRYINWIKNFLSPNTPCDVIPRNDLASTKVVDGNLVKTRPVDIIYWHHPWNECEGTGYHNTRPPWLAVWLMIIADNTLHLAINYFALMYL